MVINLDVPKDHETYLHRIGRAGRFGNLFKVCFKHGLIYLLNPPCLNAGSSILIFYYVF